MATSKALATGNAIAEAETPLLDDVVRGAVDFKGLPAIRSKSGCWKSASFIIGAEMAERFAYYGISSNLVNYLTGQLGQSTAAAAANVNAWSGTALLSPLLGAFVADSLLGRYRTIIIASLLYILGLSLLSLSAAIHSFNSSDCANAANNTACSPPQLQIVIFFFSLYLVALAQGGHQPCLQAFGADQFNENDQEECKAKSSFFNWFNFGLSAGVLVALLVMSYIQENLSWELGFGIPCIVMCFALIVFLIGSMTYRFHIKSDQKNPLVRLFRVFNKETKTLQSINEEEAQQILPHEDDQVSDGDIEDGKTILRLLRICLTCLAYGIVYSQPSTLFTKQGATMDRYITTSFQVPSASLQSLIAASVALILPFYDRVLVPIARSITQKPSGISMLQRIGTGMFLSIVCMVIAAFIERKRLATAAEYGLTNLPNSTIPMSVWWLAPQYLVLGIADGFTLVGLQELLYDQVPMDLRSIGLALSTGVTGVGSYLSSFLISIIGKATGGHGQESWFSNNLNRAHLDYFYLLLAGLNAVSFAFFVYFAKSYVYNGRTAV